MVSRALRIFGLLLLVSGAASARQEGQTLQRPGAGRSVAGSDWVQWLRSHRHGSRAGAASAAAAEHALPGQRLIRDATGRVWSQINLEAPRPARAGADWTTRRVGTWSYSYSSDGTRCVSQRTAERVFISCR